MIKKVIKIISSTIGLLIAVFLIIQLWYLPHYWINKKEVSLNSNTNEEITIMSANVRCYAPDDLFKKSWFYRADLIRNNIDEVKPDIIGFQEVTWMHYGYLQDIMQGYDSVIMYRDNFILSEGCPIFYRTDKFELIDKNSFWLSETPEVMSKDWNSACYRVCSYVKLRQINTNKEFVVFNIHLDHVSDEARINGIKVVLDKINELGDVPSYLMGDLNAKPNSKTLKSVYEFFEDGQVVADITTDGATYQKWGEKVNSERIDYIVASIGKTDIYEYGIVDTLYDGVYPSDHFPIYIKTSLK